MLDDRQVPTVTLNMSPRLHLASAIRRGSRAPDRGLTNRAGFEYRLDVEDPLLAALAGAGLSPEAEALLTAIVIEIALLNSSHVLAVITKDTRGSMWVPGDQSTARKTLPAGWQAGCWLSRLSRVVPLTPEDLQLGVITKTEGEIDTWLRHEILVWSRQSGHCSGGTSDGWRGSRPDDLDMYTDR